MKPEEAIKTSSNNKPKFFLYLRSTMERSMKEITIYRATKQSAMITYSFVLSIYSTIIIFGLQMINFYVSHCTNNKINT